MSTDLFDGTATEAQSQPKLHYACLLTEHAREKYKLPPDWAAFRYESFPPGGPRLYTQMTGCSLPPPFKSGPRKGQTNWQARDKSKDTVCHVTDAEHAAWLLSWEARTGKCHRCQGHGKEPAGGGVNGPRYRECGRCGGTGSRTETVEVEKP